MTDTMPTVSIIIPAYRRADFVNQAIDGILRQSFTDYEIILVDDCSGQEVVSRYRLPPAARLIVRAENSGRASIPRNDGWRAARGRYLAFHDMDDLWLPEKLASQVAVLDAYPNIGLTFCHYTKVNEALTPLARQKPPVCLAADVLKQLLSGNVIRTPSQALIRRLALAAVGGFDDTIICAADWDLWIRLARLTAFHADARPLMLYRRSAGQQSRQQLRMRRGGIMALEKALEWVTAEQPALLPALHRRRARLYCRYAWSQMSVHEAPAAVRESLAVAFASDPLTWRIYLGFLRYAGYATIGRLFRRNATEAVPGGPASHGGSRGPDGGT